MSSYAIPFFAEDTDTVVLQAQGRDLVHLAHCLLSEPGALGTDWQGEGTCSPELPTEAQRESQVWVLRAGACRERREEAKGTGKHRLPCTGGTPRRELPAFSVGRYEKGTGERDGAGWEDWYEESEAFWRVWDWQKGQTRCLGGRQRDFIGREGRREDWSHPCHVVGKLSVDNWFNPSAPMQEKLAKTVIFLLSHLQLLCHRQGPAVPQTVSGGK